MSHPSPCTQDSKKTPKKTQINLNIVKANGKVGGIPEEKWERRVYGLKGAVVKDIFEGCERKT